MKRHVIIFLGPPGSGKGTQAARLSAELRIPAISTGELLRQECKSGSELGQAVSALLRTGQLVGDDLMNQLVTERISREDCLRGCILDGYPRTVSQARYLDDVLVRSGMGKRTVFDFSMSGNEVVERLARRRQCTSCGKIYAVSSLDQSDGICEADGGRLARRSDDAPATILERLRIYRQHATELVRYYRQGDYRLILAGRGPAEIAAELFSALPFEMFSRHSQAVAQAAV